MENGLHTYRAEVTADSRLWDNMNIYIMVLTGDPADEKTSRAEHEAGTGTRSLSAETSEKAAYAKVSLYAVPHFLPESNEVDDSPELKLTYEILRDGVTIEKKTLPVNQWAGLQLVEMKFE